MANVLYFTPARRKINTVTIDLDTGDTAAIVRKYYHKSSGRTSLYITAGNIEQGAAALNSFINGLPPDIEKDI